jgi:hypothetical protein
MEGLDFEEFFGMGLFGMITHVGGMLLVDGEFRWNDKSQFRKPKKG